jgi:hypothetical protein
LLFVPSEVDVLGKLRTTSMLECNAQGEVLGPALEGEAPEDTLYKFKADEAKRFRSMAAGQLRPAAWCSVWNSFVRFWISELGRLKMATSANVAVYEQNAPHFNRVLRALKAHLKLHATDRGRGNAYDTGNLEGTEERAEQKDGDGPQAPLTPKTPGGESASNTADS